MNTAVRVAVRVKYRDLLKEDVDRSATIRRQVYNGNSHDRTNLIDSNEAMVEKQNDETCRLNSTNPQPPTRRKITNPKDTSSGV